MPDNWWRLPVVSGAESGQSGESGQYEAALAVAFGPTPDLSNTASMGTGQVPQQPPSGGPTLSAEDIEVLGEVNRHHRLIFAQILAVIEGQTTAFFIWGPGGHGKSFSVRSAIDLYVERVRWITTDVSAKGLFNLLRDFPTHIHVFEDMEKMYKQADCQAILRAACGGQSASERWIHWEKDGHHREAPFQFTGGIIVISNEDPRGGSLKMGAIASRFAPQQWELNEAEIAAVIRDIAINTPCPYGYSPEERLEVGEFVIGEMQNRAAKVRVDLRTYCEHALPQYHLWRDGVKSPHWHDVVRAKIKGGPRRDPAIVERERLMKAACEAYFAGSDKPSRVEEWKARTGLGASQFYEYVKLARENGIFDDYRKSASD